MGTQVNMTLTVNQDGTGSVALNENTANMTWKLAGDDAITITPTTESDQMSEITAKSSGDTLDIAMSDDSFSGNLLLSKDGKVSGIEPISLAGAKNVTNASEITGTWNLTGIQFGGISMYGDSAALSKAMGDSIDPTLTINADGTAKAMGENVTWTTDSNGCSIDLGSNVMVPIKLLDGELVIDATTIMNGTEFAMLFSK